MPKGVRGWGLGDRFWNMVAKGAPEDCWLWQGYINPYTNTGLFSYTIEKNKKKTITCYRYSWQIHYGDIPENMCIIHKCCNRQCVNPKHLFLGSNKDVTQNMFSHGRQGHWKNKGKKWKKTEEECRRISEMQKERYRDKTRNPNFGKTASESTKLKIVLGKEEARLSNIIKRPKRAKKEVVTHENSDSGKPNV